MPHFFLKLIATMDAQERAVEHFASWKSKPDAGEVPYGAGESAAADEAAARAFADADPPIKSNRGFAVYPMRAVTRAATISA